MGYSITTKDGITIDNIPEDVAPDSQILKDRVAQIRSGGKAAPAPAPAGAPQSWADVAGKALSNLPSSTANVFQGIGETVMHPVQAAENLYKIGKGSVQNVTGMGSDVEAQNMADAVNKFYKQRYGSEAGLKQAIATDPAGVMADVASLAGGGAGVLSKVPGMTKAASVLSQTASAVDPMVNALRAGKAAVAAPTWAGKQIVGMKTGVGTEALGEAYRAGEAGGKTAETFAANMRGNVPVTQVLEDAKSNLSAMNKAKQDQYRSGMVDIKNDKTALDFGDIDKALSNAEARTKFGTKITDSTANKAVEDVRAIVDDWKNSDPAQYHTPEGMDALKKKINDEVLSKLDVVKDKNAHGAIGDVYKTTKSTIEKQAPTYAKVMKDYTEASDLMTEIERTLSLGQKASADAAMRKLQSIMRNNVNTNFGNRLDLARELEAAGGKEIVPAIAGQTFNTWTPRGIQKAAAAPTSLMSYGVGGAPLAVADLAASSPRLAGEVSYGAGKLAGALRKGTAAMPQQLKNVDPRVLANILYQLNQPKGQQ